MRSLPNTTSYHVFIVVFIIVVYLVIVVFITVVLISTTMHVLAVTLGMIVGGHDRAMPSWRLEEIPHHSVTATQPFLICNSILLYPTAITSLPCRYECPSLPRGSEQLLYNMQSSRLIVMYMMLSGISLVLAISLILVDYGV